MSLPRYEKYRQSGIAWVGEIPSHWGALRTKTLFELMRRPPREEDGVVTAFRDGEVTLRTNRRTDGFTNSLQEIGYQGVRCGDLVIHAMDAFAGAIGVSDSDGKSTPVYSVCRPREGLSYSRYYGRLLRYMALSGFIESLAKGIRERSTEFRWAEAGNVYLPVPPVSEQAAIATFLDRETAKIDALIAEQEKLIALLAEKRQATISHAVTKGLNPNAPMKDSGVAWLGEVPAHWDVKPLGFLCSVLSYGFTNPMPTTDDGPYLLTANDIAMGSVNYATARRTSAEAFRNELTDKSRPKPGDILVTKDGTLGRVALFEGPEACINQSVASLRVDSKLALPHFLAMALAGGVYQERMVFDAGGTTIKHIYISRLGKMAIALPPPSEQGRIVAHVEAEQAKLDALVSEATNGIALLQERRSALIAAAVTGQIEVRNVPLR